MRAAAQRASGNYKVALEMAIPWHYPGKPWGLGLGVKVWGLGGARDGFPVA